MIMTASKNNSQKLLSSSLAQHLRLILPSDKGVQPIPGDHRVYENNTKQKCALGDESLMDLRVAFTNLLIGYVGLLEGHEHGGWTIEEETAVRAAIDALARAA
jgi:hypothetical protein